MTQERSCGTCTKCCDGWLPADIYGQQIKPGSPCRFVNNGGGCKIYDGRPEVCSTFKCAWIADSEVPDWVKPERSGVIAFRDPKHKVLIVEPAGSSVSDEYRDWAKMYASKKGLIYLESGVL